jgi:putative ABC transport system permease protein
MLTLLRQLSTRHLSAAPLRSLLIVLGIALGTAVYVAARATADAMARSFDELVERVAGRADLMVVGNQSGIPSTLVSELTEVPGVAHAAAALEITTQIAADGQPLLILGVDFLGDTHFLPFQPERGQQSVVEDPLAFANDPTALLITQSLAQRRGLKKDDELELLTTEGPTKFHVYGVLEDSGPAASFGGQVAVMFIDAAQVAFSRGILVDRIDVALAEDADPKRVSAAVAKAVAGQARVERPEQLGDRMGELSAPLRTGLSLSGLVALMVGMFIIYNAIGVAVTQRRKEVGLLRSLGVLRRQVVLQFALEAVLLALPGVGLGLLLAYTLVDLTSAQTLEALNAIYIATPSKPRITPDLIGAGAALGLLSAFVAAYLPARRGAKMDPVAALRSTSSLAAGAPVRYWALAAVGLLSVLCSPYPTRLGEAGGAIATLMNLGGAALIVPALVVLLRRLLVRPAERLLGMAGRLGLDYVERNLARSSVNVLALMTAVSMSVSMGGWLTSFEHSIRDWFEQITAADLTVTAGSPFVDRRHVPLAGDTHERLQGIPGLQAAQPVRMIEQLMNGRTFTLIASDTRAFLKQAAVRGKPWRVLEGPTTLEADALYAKPTIVLAENTAHKLGVGVGDSIELATPAGAQHFEVRAVIVDYSSEKGAGFIDRRYYLQHWNDTAIDAINLYLKPGADPDEVASQVRARLDNRKGLFVTRTTALREQFVALVQESFSYTRALELIVLVIALFGVIGTMLSAVLDRTREIGMLRAIGALHSQVTAATVVEAAFLGFCAVVGGVLTGSLQCLLFLQTLAVEQAGWHLDFVFPLAAAARIGVVVVLTAAIAGYFPGSRAASLDVKEALAYE